MTEPLTDYVRTTVNSSGTARRLLQVDVVTSGDDGIPQIPNPLICLETDDVIVFRLWVDNNNRTLSHYPVYLKNHLYNTNPAFDYGDFTQLQYYITETNVSYTSFAYSFAESGTYVFADSQENAR